MTALTNKNLSEQGIPEERRAPFSNARAATLASMGSESSSSKEGRVVGNGGVRRVL